MKAQSIIEVDDKWSSKLQKGIKGKSFEGKKLSIEVLDKKNTALVKPERGFQRKRRNERKVRNKKFKSKGRWQKTSKRK